MKRLAALLTGFVMALGLAGCTAGVPAAAHPRQAPTPVPP